MKRLVSTFIMAAILLAFVGCSSGLSLQDTTDPGTTEPEPTAHEHAYSTEIIAPTCGHGGYTLHSCECGDSYRTDEMDPLSHEYGEWVVTIEATINNEGQKEQRCLHCNERIIETIPQLEEHKHSYKNRVVAPTCTKGGYTVHSCNCGYTFADSETKALGHSWSPWNEIQAATTTETGKKVRFCQICDETESATIPKIVVTHKHSYTETVIEPTCTEKGYTLHTCSCGESYTDNETPKRGHLYGNWETTKQPTVEETGTRQCICTRCGHTHTESIAKLDPPTAEKYEHYIDPRIEIRTTGNGAIWYRYVPCSVVDTRTWGDPPSIRITDTGGLDITYYKQDGTEVSYILNPQAGFTIRLVIFEDGSFATQLTGDYND